MTETQVEKAKFIQLSNGFNIDLDEGWRKLISRQFGGHPGRGFGELIQNLLDSYPSDIPWQERIGEIRTFSKSISITDFGEGMDRKRLDLLTTLGGTDKSTDPTKIGAFGIGFFSVFSPSLETEKVTVITCCEGHPVKLCFDVVDPEKRPRISASILPVPIHFSTKIEVTFKNRRSVELCKTYALDCLRYFPCHISFDGETAFSIWEEAENRETVHFLEDHCHGFIEPRSFGQNRVKLLCKYQYLTTLSVASLVTGGHNMCHDLRDYQKKQVPLLPLTNVTLNCNNLMVTISRDNFFLNTPYHDMIQILSRNLLKYLGKMLPGLKDNQLIIANQYLLSLKIKHFIAHQHNLNTPLNEEDESLRLLAEAKVYRIAGKEGNYSLIDLENMHSSEKPFFFSVEQTNIRWAKKVFFYDFIVLPEPVSLHNGAPNLYDLLFKNLFGEIINIDTIMGDNEKIKMLVDRKIASKSALSPKCCFTKQRELSEKEASFLKQIENILMHEEVRQVIEKNLFIRCKKIQPVFFTVQDQAIIIGTGMFDKKGRALENIECSNIGHGNSREFREPIKKSTIMLGLSLQHPFIRHLFDTEDRFRIFFALIFLVYELTLCQKLLVPYSPFYHVTTRKLAADMRKALMKILLDETQPAYRNEGTE